MARAAGRLSELNRQLLGLIQLQRQQEEFDLSRSLKEAGLAEIERKRTQRENVAAQFQDPLFKESILSGMSPAEAAKLVALSPGFEKRFGGLPEGVLGPETRESYERRRRILGLASLEDPEEERRQAILTEQAKTPILLQRKTEELAATRASELEKERAERADLEKLADKLNLTGKDKAILVTMKKLPVDKETNLPSTIEAYVTREVVGGRMDLDDAIKNVQELKGKEGGLTEEDKLRIAVDLTKAELRMNEMSIVEMLISSKFPELGLEKKEDKKVQDVLNRNLGLVRDAASKLSGGGGRRGTPGQPTGPGEKGTIRLPEALLEPSGPGTAAASTKWPYGQLEPIAAPGTPASREPSREGAKGEEARAKTGRSQLSQQEVEAKAQTTIESLRNQGISDAEIRRLVGQSDRAPEEKRALMRALSRPSAGTFVTP